MLLHDSDIEKFANKNKDGFEEALHEHADLYPGLEEITTDLKKEEMEERAKEVIAGGPDEEAMSREDKADALESFAGEVENAVVVPLHTAVKGFEHPDLPNEIYRISVFPDEGAADGFDWEDDSSEYPDEARGLTFDWQDHNTDHEGRRYHGTAGSPMPDEIADDTRVGQMEIACTPVSDIPTWARPDVFDAIQDGSVGLYKNPDVAQKDRENLVQDTGDPILDDPVEDIRIQDEVQMNEVRFGEEQPEYRRFLDDQFTDPSQQAAWNVLNEQDSSGEEPIPDRNSDRFNAPVQNMTEAEKQRVRARIQRCIDRPGNFVSGLKHEDLDLKAFFNTLMRCELQGFTPPRTVGDSVVSLKTRPDVIGIIRDEAEAVGFEVLGDWVSPAPDHEIESDDIPVDFEEGDLGASYEPAN